MWRVFMLVNRLTFLVVGLIALTAVFGVLNVQAQTVDGLYTTENSGAQVRVERCGDEGAFCGWLVRRGDQLLNALTAVGSSEWEGSIRDPRTGRRYRARIALLPSGDLRVTGCLAIFCRAQVWTRTTELGDVPTLDAKRVERDG